MKRIRILTAVYSHLINLEAEVTHEDHNENGDIIYCTNIPHPEDNNTFLWVNEFDCITLGTDCSEWTLDELFSYAITQGILEPDAEFSNWINDRTDLYRMVQDDLDNS